MLELSQKGLRSALYLLTKKRTWADIEYFDPSWKKRIKAMAHYLPEGASILDLGCEKMWLKKYHTSSTYFPVDYRSRGQDTIICDFNKGEFPTEKADVAFVSGTLEYVTRGEWFVSKIAQNTNECVLSYCVLEEHPVLAFRRKQAWVNDYSRADILELFSTAGFKLKEESEEITKNHIFHFVKEA